jgi:hypothetical protein
MQRDVYLKAAKAVFDVDHGACVAIHQASPHRFNDGSKWTHFSRDSLAFQKLFCPFGEEHYFDSWLHLAEKHGFIEESEVHEWRVTALCFMAAIADSGR